MFVCLFFLEAPASEKPNRIHLLTLKNSHHLCNIIYLINALNCDELCKVLAGKLLETSSLCF